MQQTDVPKTQRRRCVCVCVLCVCLRVCFTVCLCVCLSVGRLVGLFSTVMLCILCLSI